MTGNVDISTGRVAGFAGMIMSVLCVDAGWSAPAAIAVALASACLIGLFNGFLVVHMGVPDFVATMSTLYMVGGARYLFIKGYQLSLNTLEGFTLTDAFDQRYLGMPLDFWIMLALFVIVFIVIMTMGIVF